MKFAIQYNLMNGEQLSKIRAATDRYPRVFVGCLPFSHELTCNEELSGVDYIPYGSTLFNTIAHNLNWRGLHSNPTTMNYRACLENRTDMLNSNVMSLIDATTFLRDAPAASLWFVRPSHDLKQFSGCVQTAAELVAWFESMMAAVGGGSYYMAPDQEIVLCEPQAIHAEWRWFIVGGQIVSGSMYRAHGQLRRIAEDDFAVISEAQQLADIWLPDQCVVMDTAYTDCGVKVIEFNSINSSGFYDNDIPAVFDALYEYHTK